MRIRLPTFVAIVLLPLACGGNAWDAKGAPKVAPDEQFRTGVEVGYDAFVWNCYAGERVVVTQSGSACLGTSRPRITRGPCGTPLPVESTFPPVDAGRDDIPKDYRWPGSPP